ncbi:hypothetical protein N7494_002823 [Penicillium frequentans]|uniref:MICOS complex subunit MIC10 n=2 Tax=Penicillium TaxID=5073 RepID=A0AAD6D6T0_9EURO|nr:hypothetical protein N7494_002823 [Penicillium glabrum]
MSNGKKTAAKFPTAFDPIFLVNSRLLALFSFRPHLLSSIALLNSTFFTMADSSESRSVARATKPVSEALLNEKWDRAISSMIIKSSLGLSFGVVFSVLLFKRRAWPAWVGLGFGAGRAWEESDASFRRGGSSITDALRR